MSPHLIASEFRMPPRQPRSSYRCRPRLGTPPLKEDAHPIFSNRTRHWADLFFPEIFPAKYRRPPGVAPFKTFALFRPLAGLGRIWAAVRTLEGCALICIRPRPYVVSFPLKIEGFQIYGNILALICAQLRPCPKIGSRVLSQGEGAGAFFYG